jgi:hypothetical protein
MYQYLIEHSILISIYIFAIIAAMFFFSVVLNKNLTRWSLDTEIHKHLLRLRKKIIIARKIIYPIIQVLFVVTIAYKYEYSAFATLLLSAVALSMEVYWFSLRCSLVSKLIKACKKAAKNKNLYSYGIYLTQDQCWVSAKETSSDDIKKYRFCGDYDFSLKQWNITNFYCVGC